MPKTRNNFNDFDELLAKSQRLVSGIARDPSNTGSNRGIAELGLASKEISRGPIDERSLVDASRLLSQKNFDLNHNVSSAFVKTPDESLTKLEGTDIEGYLAHHHDTILLAAIDESRRNCERDIEEMQRDWLQNEWYAARSEFMDSLGHRAHQWGQGEGQQQQQQANDSYFGFTAPSSSSAHNVDKSFSASKSNSRLALSVFSPTGSVYSQHPHNHQMMAISGPGAYGDASQLNTPAKGFFGQPGSSAKTPQSHRQPPSSLEQAGNQLRSAPVSDFLNHHWQIIRSLNLASSPVPLSNRQVAGVEYLASPCREMSKFSVAAPHNMSAKTVVTDGLTKADLGAYRQCMAFLSYIVGEDRPNSNLSVGQFSSICFEGKDTNHNVLENCRAFLSNGAKRYLEMQVRDLWDSVLEDAVRSGQVPAVMSTQREGTSRMQRLRTYIAFKVHTGRIPQNCLNVLCPTQGGGGSRDLEVPLWAFVYHCVRSGDIKGAVEELRVCVNMGYDNGEEAAVTVLQCLARVMGDQAKAPDWESPAVASQTLADAELKALNEAMRTCLQLYSMDMNLADQGRDIDYYRTTVLNLLSLADRDGLSNGLIPGSQLEDFLWSHLWFIQTARMVGDKSSAFYATLVSQDAYSASRAKATSSGELELFELLLKYGGADYFDQDRTTPFKYAIVLLCCQRFGDAIAHLYSANRTVAAVHLTAVCLHYGLILPFVPLTQNPYHPMAGGGMRPLGLVSSADPTPWVVLQTFASSSSVSPYPGIVLDYIMCLDSQWLKHATGLEDELKKVSKVKAQTVLTSTLEGFLQSLDMAGLTAVLGSIPPNINSATIGTRARTMDGRLDEYMGAAQIELLLCRTASNLVKRDLQKAVYLYQLAGRYGEVVDELCQRLAAQLVPSQGVGASQREFWFRFCSNFSEQFLLPHSPNSLLVHLEEGNSRHSVDALRTLGGLYRAVDEFLSPSSSSLEVIKLIDESRLLPTSDEHIDVCSAPRPQFKRVLDDLAKLYAETIKRLYDQARSERSAQASGGFGGLTTDRDVTMHQLKIRAKVLLVFVSRNRNRLFAHDTEQFVADVEAKIFC